MLPQITAIGNIGRMEMKYTQQGKAFMKFQVECSEKNSKGEYQNLYLDGEVWEKSAEFVNQYFNDGDVVIVTGKLYTNVYEKDGKKVYQNKLLFPNVSFAPKPKSSNAPKQQTQTYAQPTQHEQQKQNGYMPQPEPIDISSDDVPF